MVFKHSRTAFILALMILSVGSVFILDAGMVWAQDVKVYADAVEQGKQGMTLWETLQTGGFIMKVLGVLSIVAVALILLNFFSLNSGSIVPKKFAEEVVSNLEQGKFNIARNLCQGKNNAIANIVLAGLDKKKRGAVFAKEAMEMTIRKEMSGLWQNLSYLADIAAIAPLIGLLGTVLGMIQAFNVIAFQTAVVKPILLAAGVSKAMVTTAGGLSVAIPVMLFHSFFRGKVQSISNQIETYGTDIIKLIEEM